MNFLKISLVVICLPILLYVLHVPLLKLWTAPFIRPNLASYSALTDGVEGQRYKIEKISNGSILDVYYLASDKIYIILVDYHKTDQNDYYGRYIILLEENGDLRDIGLASGPDLETLDHATNLEQMPLVGGRKYVPEFSFPDYKGAIELQHYQFQNLVEWPYMYFFIPVIASDWDGMAYLNIHHDGDHLKFKTPTNFFGGYLYTSSNIDGQIYLRKRRGDAAGLTFLQVDESSHTRDMNGHETHREGYGLYLIRRK